ncbi:MAG: Smr/MutS family protein [Candidatus Aminicenantes bacterium]|nr:Smr/MutS family protein [Candidatus Aminicenantes bacterium]
MSRDTPVEIPIDGILDLHAFNPREVKDLVMTYIEECARRGIPSIRLIHGKGRGTLKRIVHELLKKNPHVLSFEDADSGAGGWGATVARIKVGSDHMAGSS